MRTEEGTSLLVHEIPSREEEATLPAGESYVHPLAKACVKRKKRSRKVYIPRQAIEQLREYIDVERADVIARVAAKGAYAPNEIFTLVEPVPDARKFRGRNSDGEAYLLGFDGLGPRERRRLLVAGRHGGAEPASLLLAHDTGLPINSGYWNGVMRKARKRCLRFGRSIAVSPHVLRHTYAVHSLSKFIAASIEHSLALQHGKPGERAYEVMFGDALQMLRDALGHVSVTTTYLYLHSVRDSRRIVNQAAVSLAKDVMGGVYVDD